MSDHLKLSDPNGDTEVDTIASALENADNSKRIEQLKKNIQDLKRLLAEREQAASKASASAAPNNKIGARKDGIFKAISTAPSFNLTPVGPSMVPLPYPTTIDLSNSTDVASSVRFNGKQVYTLGSSQANCKGDEQGSGGGVKSGTVNGEVKPSGASTTVRVEGKRVVRDGDPCTMNGGNNSGIYLTVPPTSGAAPRDALATSNPPVKLETPAEESAFKKWLDHTLDAMQQAVKSPIEGMKGAIKGTVNVLPNLAELLLKAAKEQSATQMEEAAITHTMFGQTDAAKTMREVAAETRKQEATLNVPKFKMSNSAQEGGEAISTVVQIFASGAGVIKGATKGLAAAGETGSAANAGSKLSTEMTFAFDEVKPITAEGDGVLIQGSGSETVGETAADRSASFQGTAPYEGIDRLRNIALPETSQIAHITFREDGIPISEYFTTKSAIDRSRLPDGSIDANRLNQGLQIYAGKDPLTGLQRPNFKPFVQFFEVKKPIPYGEAAFGRTLENPLLNPDNYNTLPQIFIKKEVHSSLQPFEIEKTINTNTPKYNL